MNKKCFLERKIIININKFITIKSNLINVELPSIIPPIKKFLFIKNKLKSIKKIAAGIVLPLKISSIYVGLHIKEIIPINLYQFGKLRFFSKLANKFIDMQEINIFKIIAFSGRSPINFEIKANKIGYPNGKEADFKSEK